MTKPTPITIDIPVNATTDYMLGQQLARGLKSHGIAEDAPMESLRIRGVPEGHPISAGVAMYPLVGIAEVTLAVSAPRIDTVRRELNRVIHRVGLALEHLEDLHTLATDRPRAALTERTSGGDPTAVGIDLDTHGDTRARAAYVHLAEEAMRAGDKLGNAIDAAQAMFDPGLIRQRTDRSADATTTEVVGALAAQERRHANGQAGSVATVRQPMPRGGTRALDADRITKELDALRAVARKMHADGIRPDRARLTPLELGAWQTATGTTPKGRKKGRRA